VRIIERAHEQSHRPWEHYEGDEDADGEEGHELDDRFRRDREHQAVLMLGGVDVARAEQHSEGRHQQSDEQRDVAEERLHRGAAGRDIRDDGADRRRHRFELQRDVGDHADDRDQRDGRRHRLTLAVARGDEVGDRGDVLALGEPHDADDERIGEAHHQHRSDIDGEKVKAGARRHTNRTEERPRGAVDRQRQRIDEKPRAAAADALAAAVAVTRYQEQKPDIGERDDDNEPTLQHQDTRIGVSTALARYQGAPGPRPSLSFGL
jgi:hypothetical protein